MKKYFAVIMTALLLVCCDCGCSAEQKEQDGRIRKVQNADTAMGTVIQQTLYTTEDGTETTAEIMELLRELEENVLSRRVDTSEVGSLNAAAGRTQGSSLSDSMKEILEGCLEMWQKSDGAFDVMMGQVVSLWDIDGWAAGERAGMFMLPAEEQLRKALENRGSGGLDIRDGRLYLPEGAQLDLGAVGKGIALDYIFAYLQEKDEITGAIISLGGSILTYGQKPDGQCWNIGIVNPADTASNAGILKLEGEWFVSTSGDYERYVDLNGVRYHHIIDPATGYPADSGVAGVTILAKDGFFSDALSTACFILGVEKGMALAESYGVEVLFVGKDGSITMSRGMESYYSNAFQIENCVSDSFAD